MCCRLLGCSPGCPAMPPSCITQLCVITLQHLFSGRTSSMGAVKLLSFSLILNYQVNKHRDKKNELLKQCKVPFCLVQDSPWYMMKETKGRALSAPPGRASALTQAEGIQTKRSCRIPPFQCQSPCVLPVQQGEGVGGGLCGRNLLIMRKNSASSSCS